MGTASKRVPRKERKALDPRAKLWATFRRRRGPMERNALVESYQTLIADTVRRFAARLPRTVDPGDLLTAANVGLMAAVECFDPTRGVPFEAYGELRIKGALLDELRIQDWLPRPWRARLERHKRLLEELRARHGREPREDEIAAALDLPPEEYSLYFGRGGPLSTPTLTHGDSADGATIDIVPDTHSDAPGERLTREELLALVAQRLSPQEYRIVYLKYWEELPMREIGELEGLSESRVCKIHTHLLERLQERFHVGTSAE